jgi:hypothetical protein
VWAKGERRRTNRTHPFNGIMFASGLDERRSPTDHVTALIARLRPHSAQIAAVAARPTTHSTRVTVVEHTLRDNVGTWVEPSELAAIAKMGAQLFVDIYFYDEDE